MLQGHFGDLREHFFRVAGTIFDIAGTLFHIAGTLIRKSKLKKSTAIPLWIFSVILIT